MIYDCFIFYNENDLFEIRLNILKNTVDKFVIIESRKTHKGAEKPLNFDLERFRAYKDKIIYKVIDFEQRLDLKEYELPWINENLQRNYIFDALRETAQENDVVIISDCDEIINPEAIIEYKNNHTGIMALEQNFYYYYLNMQNVKGKYWYAPRIMRYKDFFDKNNDKGFIYNRFLIKELNEGLTPNKIRLKTDCPTLRNGGWHFSFLGGADKIIEKIKAYSHQEYNKPCYTDKKYVEESLLNGKDIFNRKGYRFLPVKIDKTYPEYVLDNIENLKDWIFEIPDNKKIFVSILSFYYSFLDFLFSKRKDGIRRIIKILGVEIKYKKSKS